MKTILVIDDEEPVLANLLDLLKSENFLTLGACTGAGGVQMARSRIPDLILCDILMPDLDGYEVLTTLRQDPRTSAIPLIFLTAKATPGDYRYGMALGADDYLTKPFSRQDLLSAIHARLERQITLAQQYIGELQEIERKIYESVHYDSITGLPNRSLLPTLLEELLLQSPGKRAAAVITLRSDRLIQINDTLGYTQGDLLLQAIAQRIVACMTENARVARLHADRFAIVLTAADLPTAAVELAETLLQALSQPFLLDGYEISATTSIGIAFSPEHGLDINTLIRHANTAMGYPLQQGIHGYQIYSQPMNQRVQVELSLEAHLHHALERSELSVYYQPQVDLVTGTIVGVEALLRWQPSPGKWIPPARLIPIAEASGLIIPIGEWVLRQACQQARTWQQLGFAEIRVGVNLSASQFHQPDLSQRILAVLQDTGLAPDHLEMELTESLFVQDTATTVRILEQLRAAGVRLAIDDFGTGYSSLSSLRQFPFHTLKIDQSFICQLPGNLKNMAITTAIISMAHHLGLTVIAEGVQTQATLSFLQDHLCDQAQGYLLSPAVSAKELTALLQRGRFPMFSATLLNDGKGDAP